MATDSLKKKKKKWPLTLCLYDKITLYLCHPLVCILDSFRFFHSHIPSNILHKQPSSAMDIIL